MFFEFLIQFLNLKIKPKDINVFILGSIEESTILAFLVYLNSYRNNGANTRKRIIASIKSFYKWLFVKYYNTLKHKKNPTINLPQIESQKRLPKYISLNDAKKLLNIFNEENCKNPTRNNTIITLFLNCGLRLSELENIDVNDINLEKKSLIVIGKGNKERTVYLNQSCIDSINEYLKIRNCNQNALFLNKNNTRLSNVSIGNICIRAFELAGLSEKGYTPHTLRHTSVTIMYNLTKDLLVVKEFLGHESILSTEIYSHVSNEELKNAINNNPLNNIYC